VAELAAKERQFGEELQTVERVVMLERAGLNHRRTNFEGIRRKTERELANKFTECAMLAGPSQLITSVCNSLAHVAFISRVVGRQECKRLWQTAVCS